MTVFISLVLIVALAYLGSLVFHWAEKSRPWVKVLAYTGSIYVIIGYLIGPEVLKLIDHHINEQLGVLFTLVLGWIGFLIGLQISKSGLVRFPRFYFTYSITNFLFIFGLTFALLGLIFRYFDPGFNYSEILVLSIAAAVTSPLIIAVYIREKILGRRLAHMLQFSAAFDNLLGVLVLGIIMALLSSLVIFEDIKVGFLFIFLLIPLGLFMSYVYELISRDIQSDTENFVFILGLLLFLTGLAYYFEQSILCIAFIFGAGVSTRSKNVKSLYFSIQKVEKPLYILLLIFIGANIDHGASNSLVYLVIFITAHFFINVVSGLLSKHLLQKNIELPSMLGLSKVSLGGLSLAIIMDFHLTSPSIYSEMLLFILAINLILNDVLSFKLAGKIFKT